MKKGPMSEEHKRKISAAQRGKPRFYNRGNMNVTKRPEVRVKLSLALKGIPKSTAHAAKCRITMLGKKHSIETRLKMSRTARNKVLNGTHHLWRGGLNVLHKSERNIIEQTLEYRLWHEAVLKRDYFSCRECGQRGGKLHVDHIKPFALFPELRVALNNGRTMCVPCHRKTPTFGGKIFNILTKAT